MKTRTSSLKENRRSWTTRQGLGGSPPDEDCGGYHQNRTALRRKLLAARGRGRRRRCRQSWTVVHPARRRRALAHLRSLARVRVKGKSRVIPYQILEIVVVDGEGREGR